jgi:predicted GIY-YIG superfamily endonuclease
LQVTEVLADVAAGTANHAAIGLEITGEPTALYRFYDASDTLLYVGVSSNPAVRWGTHATEKHWWPQVARKTIVVYGSRMEAEIAEGIAIRSESPVHNKAAGRRDPATIPAPKPWIKRKVAATQQPPRLLPRRSVVYDLGPYQRFIEEYAQREGNSEADAAGRLLFAGVMEDYLRRFGDEGLDILKAEVELHMKPSAAKRR